MELQFSWASWRSRTLSLLPMSSPTLAQSDHSHAGKRRLIPLSTFSYVLIRAQETLKGFLESKNCVKSCSMDGLMKTLEALTADLELCEKALADFLEAKRRIFPRFYFVSQARIALQ